jgi:predicted nuclease with RNAse H fold
LGASVKIECIYHNWKFGDKPENPTGWSLLEKKRVKTTILYDDDEIIKRTACYSPQVVAIDVPFALPKTGLLRKADRQIISKEYRVFAPMLRAMRSLTNTHHAIKQITNSSRLQDYRSNPTSTREAQNISTKNIAEIQIIFKNMGLQGTLQTKVLAFDEIDPITAALTAVFTCKTKRKA